MLNAFGAEGPVEMGIMFSHTCNIECRHCGILSGPKNRDRMTLRFAQDCIRQAAELKPRPSTIVFTGGEPFLFLRELESLLELSNELGFSNRAITNGFWGRNPESGRRILARLRLAGLDSLNFSADKYHLEFLPAYVLRQALDLARGSGLLAIVNMVINEPGDPVEMFARLYGIRPDEIRLFQEEEFARQWREGIVPPEVYSKINLTYGRLIGLGRCAEYPEEHYRTGIEGFTHRACGEVVNRPVIYPNGDLQACCCAGGKIAEFRVGSLHEESLPALVERMRRRTHYRFINSFGPRHLYEAIGAAYPERATARDHASICDLCVAATRGLDAAEVDNVLELWGIGQLVGAGLLARANPAPHSAALVWPAPAK